MNKFAIICAALIAVLSCCTIAQAAEKDFCPASVDAAKPDASPTPAVPASTLHYRLGARSERVVESASMIADTDRGWYAWSVAVIPIGKSLRSDPLQVTFPQDVTIRHAWVTASSLSTLTPYPWKTDQSYACDVPAYSNRGIPESEEAREQSRRPKASPAPVVAALPAPSPGALKTVAYPAALPFDSIECEVPFHQAYVTMAQRPDYPAGFDAGQLTTQIEVQIDETGNLLNASVYKSSGAKAFDISALRAARLSAYMPAVSYCQKVLGDYLFTATFQGRR